jgi:hypothetical protein
VRDASAQNGVLRRRTKNHGGILPEIVINLICYRLCLLFATINNLWNCFVLENNLMLFLAIERALRLMPKKLSTESMAAAMLARFRTSDGKRSFSRRGEPCGSTIRSPKTAERNALLIPAGGSRTGSNSTVSKTQGSARVDQRCRSRPAEPRERPPRKSGFPLVPPHGGPRRLRASYARHRPRNGWWIGCVRATLH